MFHQLVRSLPQSTPSVWEQRRHPRLSIELEVELETGGIAIPARLVEASERGLRLVVSRKLTPDTRVRIAQLAGRVRWSHLRLQGDWETGLDLDEPLRLGQARPRRARRFPVALSVQLNGRPARTCDLSLDGAQLKVCDPPPRGRGVDLVLGPIGELPTLTLRARVLASRRVHGQTYCHLRFVGRSTDELNQLVAYLRLAQSRRPI